MQNSKTLPFDQQTINEIAARFPTPFYLYDERGIRDSARKLNAAFDWCSSFREFFAVKATPNPHILRMLSEEGLGAWHELFRTLQGAEAWAEHGAWIERTKPKLGPFCLERMRLPTRTGIR